EFRRVLFRSDRAFGLQKLGILLAARSGSAASAGPDGAHALRIGHQAPADADTFGEQLRPAGMERLDRFAAHAQPLGVAETRKFLRVVAVGPAGSISGNQHGLW